jgi:hypothetical protein
MYDQRTPTQRVRPKPHYFVGTFYLLVTLAAIALAVQAADPKPLLVAVLTGLYSVYLFRGGRWVIVFF